MTLTLVGQTLTYLGIAANCTKVQNPCYIYCYPEWCECLLIGLGQTTLQNFAGFTQNTVQQTRIHTFGMNCLKASTDKDAF